MSDRVARAVWAQTGASRREQQKLAALAKECKAAGNQLLKALGDGRPTLAAHALERLREAAREADGWL